MSKQAIIVISSHVARGSVGNRAAVFALETLGFPVWAIPTITLPWHPGHGSSTRIIAQDEDFSQFLADIASAPWIHEVGAVLSGYMANARQVHAVANLVKTLKSNNPDITYLCDPVIGDTGGLYIPQETACAIRDELIPICDLATPNRFELSWLLNEKVPTTTDATLKLAATLGPENVMTTSAPTDSNHQIGNLFLNKELRLLASHDEFKNPPNGPGDLTAAIYLGHMLDQMTPRENLIQTTASVFEILQTATLRGSDELALESDAKSITRPQAQIKITDLQDLKA